MILESLHLRGAAGAVRIEPYDGRDHFVLPCVALIGDQIIHAVNAEHPERVPTSTLVKAAETFNLKPVVLGHPKKDGKQCSANSPDVLNSNGIGFIKNSRVEGKRLLCEAWIDPVKARHLGGQQFVEDLHANKPCDVSVGAFVSCDSIPGEINGKKFLASWLETIGDHLAILWPGGRGACSWESGCGIRAAMHLVTAEAIEVLAKKKYDDCPTCKGSGNVNGNPCEACDSNGEVRVASISTPSSSTGTITVTSTGDMTTVIPKAAAVKPQPKAAGCGCKAACSCTHHHGGRIMEKSTRAELIAALVTDKYSGFKDGDEAILEAASDARLEDFRTASRGAEDSARANAKLETEQRNVSARLKVAEERLKTAEQGPTEEEWLAKAPPQIKALLDAHKAEEDAYRASLIIQLKDLGANTEEELKAKGTKDLETLAKYAHVTVPDFSGRGIPVERHASVTNDDYTPPDPYTVGLKALQGQSKAVN